MAYPSYQTTLNRGVENPADYHRAVFGQNGAFIVDSSAQPFKVFTTGNKKFDITTTADSTGVKATITCSSGSVFTDVEEGQWVMVRDASANPIFETSILEVDSSNKILTVYDENSDLGTRGTGGTVEVVSLGGTVCLQVLEDVTGFSAVEKNKYGGDYPTTLTAGTFIYGDFTEVSLTTGTIKVYLR